MLASYVGESGTIRRVGLCGLVDTVLASVTALPAALGALACYEIGTSPDNVTFSMVIQSYVPDLLLGRVFSAFGLICQSIRLAGLLLVGLLADFAGIRRLLPDSIGA